jgi:branched-chain amino acid transport system ATP-binding protein
VILELDDIQTYYGESHILQGVSLTVGNGEVVALLGRNGAGKTTTMRSIVGLTPARRGRITFDGAEIVKAPTHRIAKSGIAFVASGRRVFGSLTVGQNLALAARTHARRRGEAPSWTVERLLEIFPKLRELMGRRAEFLSGGEQQMLKLGRALLSSPKLLLLDEPTEGLSPAVVGDLGRWLELLRAEGLPVLLTEQNALFALRHADRGYVMEKGRITHTASAADLADSEEIRVSLGLGSTTDTGRGNA